MERRNEISIGQLSRRTGVAVSAIRFYEEQGLLRSERTAGGQRRFLRSDIRRVSFILIAQQLGFSLARIGQALSRLPMARTPTPADWRALSEEFGAELDQRIAALTRMRDTLDSCIGCGCLSLDKCALYNPADRAGANGTGPRYLIGDSPRPAPFDGWDDI